MLENCPMLTTWENINFKHLSMTQFWKLRNLTYDVRDFRYNIKYNQNFVSVYWCEIVRGNNKFYTHACPHIHLSLSFSLSLSLSFFLSLSHSHHSLSLTHTHTHTHTPRERERERERERDFTNLVFLWKVVTHKLQQISSYCLFRNPTQMSHLSYLFSLITVSNLCWYRKVPNPFNQWIRCFQTDGFSKLFQRQFLMPFKWYVS